MKNQDAYGSRPLKRLKYGMAFLALVGIGVTSCEKENVIDAQSNLYRTIDFWRWIRRQSERYKAALWIFIGNKS